ncbi:hypothetical protein NDJ79_01155 [Escherichia coli]|uniref:hypothetical protein n=1 Tax=Escherichia coli TaxID=562 RepID=UPI0020C756C1|nr:hypothetical protein [Escherichia coli]MCP8760155.1 hypothetical protein [Escherichia coli]
MTPRSCSGTGNKLPARRWTYLATMFSCFPATISQINGSWLAKDTCKNVIALGPSGWLVYC